MKQKTWILLFAAVCAVCIAVWLLPRAGGETVLVYQDGTLLYRLDLRSDQTLTISGPAGEAALTASGGEIFVSHADCPDQICVKHGPLKKTGGPIVCLPNRLTVDWEKSAAPVDAVTGTGGIS